MTNTIDKLSGMANDRTETMQLKTSQDDVIEKSLRTALKINPLTATGYYAFNSKELKEDLNTLKEIDQKPVMTFIKGLTSPVIGLIYTVKSLFAWY